MTSVAKYTKDAKAVIDKIRYITLATVSEEGIPWNSPVWYKRDKDYNFYSYSPKNTQHSQNIRANGKVFIVIFDSTASSGDAFGVYMKAKGEEISVKSEAEKIIKLIWGKEADSKDPNYFLGGGPLRFYKFTLIDVWVNDSDMKKGVYHDYRIPIKLNGQK